MLFVLLLHLETFCREHTRDRRRSRRRRSRRKVIGGGGERERAGE
jgi:hypothetical protein